MNRETYYMIDIETTGVDKETDDVLEIALVPIQFLDGYWHVMGEVFKRRVYSNRRPQNKFAVEHMTPLYDACNALNPIKDGIRHITEELKHYLHGEGSYVNEPHQTPKFFMGWNASNFDLEFLFRKGVLTPSYYNLEGDKEVLRGDVHYRVYEQTGAIEFMIDVTGLTRKSLMDLVIQMVPADVKLQNEGISHDGLDDCYYQINMMNGLIALARSGFKLPGMTV